nr:hypothetical protein [Tanacetum cinerariifolium]
VTRKVDQFGTMFKELFIRSGRIPVSATKPKAAVSTSVAKPINTARPKEGNGVTTVMTSTGYVWRPRMNAIDQLSKDNRWICTHVDYVDPQGSSTPSFKEQINS